MLEELVAFIDLLRSAAAHVDEPFFQLPVAGRESPIYRERVYAYELYHQLRTHWPIALDRYSLGGEVDKTGHPLIRGNGLDAAKPDLIVHKPGEMTGNLAVVEIKSWLPTPAEVRRDLEKLAMFCDRGGYFAGLYLIYGSFEADSQEVIRERCRTEARELGISGAPLRLVLHRAAGSAPVILSL